MADINIGQISEALNNKTDRDFNNMDPSALSKATVASWSTPDYNAGVSKSWNTEYIAEVDGYLFASTTSDNQSKTAALIIDGTSYPFGLATGYTIRTSESMPITKGLSYMGSGVRPGTLIFYPLKGVK